MVEQNFTFGSNTAKKFGVHEVVMEACEIKGNPFDINCTVEFTSPSGEKTTTVNAFYDGGVIWRARLYATEEGEWNWRSDCPEVPELDGQCGKFKAEASNLRGMLRKCPDNPRQWRTDDGKWFLNTSDTAYPLFHPKETMWREYVRDLAELGITSTRCISLGGYAWIIGDNGIVPGVRNRASYELECEFYPWDKKDINRLDLHKFQTTDERLVWMLENYPDIYIQFIIIALEQNERENTAKAWKEIPERIRKNLMKYMIARWAAFPQLFWLVINDIWCSAEYPENQAFIREVGNYFADHDPWHHLLSVGPPRYADFPFLTAEDMKWVSYIHIEDSQAFDAEVIDRYAGYPFHVFLGEDRYEQDYCGVRASMYNPQYYYRWLFWSWLLSGGSANYGGRWGNAHPYFSTGSIEYWDPYTTKYAHQELRGLHSIRYIKDFFEGRGISLEQFIPDHKLVADADGREKNGYIKLMRKDYAEFILYHPNTCQTGLMASPDENRQAGLYVDFNYLDFARFTVNYDMEWYRPSDGVSEKGGQFVGKGRIKFVAPWKGADAVLYLKKRI